MDIGEMVANAILHAIEAEGHCLKEKAYQMRPMIRGDLSYTAFIEFGKRSDDLANTVDSTAIVIDENVKALPEPTKGA